MLLITIIVLIAYLIFMLLIGNYAASKSTGKSEAEYFVTGWTTGWIGISFSIAATFAGAGYTLGTMGVFYGNPAALTGYAFGTTFAPFLLWILGRRIWVVGRKYGYSTFTDLIGDFYRSEKLRMVVSIIIVLFFSPYLATNLIGPAILLKQASGGSIPYWAGAVAFAAVAIIYTWQGGMRAVIWTDIAQAVIIIAGFAIIIPVTFSVAGGWSAVWEKLPEQVALYKPRGGSFWIVWSWFFIVGLMQPGNPDRAFRLLVAKNLGQVQKGVLMSLVWLTIWTLVGFFMGWSLAVAIPGITKTDLVMGEAINRFMPYLMPIFTVAVWAAGMSTLDSGMIGLGAMVTKDIYRRNINPKATDNRVFRLGQVLTLVLGVFALFVSLVNPKDLWFYIAGAAAVSMMWLPQILGALYWKRATPAGAWAGFVAGVAVTVYFIYVAKCPIPGPGGAPDIGDGCKFLIVFYSQPGN